MVEILKEADLEAELGRIIYDRYMGPAVLDMEVGADTKLLCTQWLVAMGFQAIAWMQTEDDDLFLHLWYEDAGKAHAFLLLFDGDDGREITVYHPVKAIHA
jgi:hypothetical protein